MANWHERLEVFMPLDGPARMRMGDETVELRAGDLLVVDNFKLHQLEVFPGFKTRIISVSFLPEFVSSPGSPSYDYAFLIPFYAARKSHPHVLRATDQPAATVYLALAELLGRYFHPEEALYASAGCKLSLMQVLYELARKFQASEVFRSEYVRRQHEAERLAPLFEYVQEHYAERISVTQATQLVHMSVPQFMKAFKKVAGVTFLAHVTRVRIMNALRQLRETDSTVAEIAAKCGFSDQSHFDRRFRQAFGKSPRQWRRSHLLTTASPASMGEDPHPPTQTR
jgi:AraC-like DNA-binding protein